MQIAVTVFNLCVAYFDYCFWISGAYMYASKDKNNGKITASVFVFAECFICLMVP